MIGGGSEVGSLFFEVRFFERDSALRLTRRFRAVFPIFRDPDGDREEDDDFRREGPSPELRSWFSSRLIMEGHPDW